MFIKYRNDKQRDTFFIIILLNFKRYINTDFTSELKLKAIYIRHINAILKI